MSDGKPLFKKDATFNVRYGLGASNSNFGISFESFNMPGKKLVCINSHLRPKRNHRDFILKFENVFDKNLSSLASGLPWGYSLYILKDKKLYADGKNSKCYESLINKYQVIKR